MPKKTDWLSRPADGIEVTPGGWLQLVWVHELRVFARSRAVPPSGVVNGNSETFLDMVARNGGIRPDMFCRAEYATEYNQPESRASKIAKRIAGLYSIRYLAHVTYPKSRSTAECSSWINESVQPDTARVWPEYDGHRILLTVVHTHLDDDTFQVALRRQQIRSLAIYIIDHPEFLVVDDNKEAFEDIYRKATETN